MDDVLDVLSEVVESGREAQPQDSMLAAKRMLLDALGCALGGYRESAPVLARGVVSRRATPKGCGVFGLTEKVPADLAVFANSVMIRFLDFNDTYGSSVGVGHPSDYIPAALAGLSGQPITGELALRGILVAYEVFARLTDATRLGVERVDHVVNGAVASAAASAVVNQLSPAQARTAMSLAVTANVALQATRLGTLSMWKGCAAGNACRNGVFAAELAAAGLTGPEAPFLGRGGLASVTREEIDTVALRREGLRPAIMDCHVKRFPSGYFSQGAVEAALEVYRQVGEADYADVEIGTFEFGKRVMAGDPEKWHPTTRETADHSIPYVVACALARGSVTITDLDESRLDDASVAKLLDVLRVEVDPECATAWPEACMNRVSVRTASGQTVSETVRYYRGHANNPLTDAELATKFAEQAELLLAPQRAKELVETVWALADADSVDPLFSWAPADSSASR